MRKRPWVGLVGAVGACEAVGGMGALLTRRGVEEWLPSLEQPRLQPPDWVFGPVWTVIYAMIGFSWHELRRSEPGRARRQAQAWLALQMVLNGLWSYLFFGRRRVGLALVDSIALAASVGASVVTVSRVSRPAGAALVPYLGWVTFATGLNAALWRKNR